MCMMYQLKKVNAIQITDTGDLVNEADYKTKIGEIEKKILDHYYNEYITTREFDKLTVEDFAARRKQAKVTTRSDIADFAKKNILMKN